MRYSKLTTFVIAGLLLGLLASLLVNLLLIQRARHFARMMYVVSLDPLGVGRYPAGADSALAELPPGMRRVVFFGDSRARQWHAPEQSGAFSFVNRGIDGQTTTQALGRFDAHVPGLDPDVVVVQVGTNDLMAIALMPGERDLIVANSKAHIQQIVERSRSLGATVILTTIIPIGDLPLAPRLFWSEEVRVAIAEVNAFLAGLAAEDVLVLDTAPPLADADGGIRPAYQADYLHLNRAGYEVLNRELLAVLEQVP